MHHLSSPETRRCFTPTTSRTIAMLRPLCFAQWDRLFYFSGQAMKSLDVPKCKSICPQQLNPGVSIHLSSFAMSSSLFRDASEEAMIVCSCNVFSDHQVRSVVAKEARRPRMSDVYACLGCSAKCGRCAHTIKRILDDRPGSVHANATMY
jgi:bacterioferritin-associated ferredoxin